MKTRNLVSLGVTAVLAGCLAAGSTNAALIASVDFNRDGASSGSGPAGTPASWTSYTNTDGTVALGGGVSILVNEYGSTNVATDNLPNVNHTFVSPGSGLESTDPPESGPNAAFYASGPLAQVLFDRPDTAGFAVLVSGLGAGTYDFYTIGVENQQTGRDYNSNIQAGAGLTFNSRAGADGTVDPTSPGSWVDGDNYIKQTVTVAAGENVAVFYNSTNNDFTSLSGIQIDLVPEPSSLAMVVGFAASGLMYARRRR